MMKPRRVAILLCSQFSMLVYIQISELFRIANLGIGENVFETHTYSADGKSVQASNGRSADVDGATSEAHIRYDHVLMCASYEPEAAPRGLDAYLRKAHAYGASVGGIDTGSWILARAGLLDGVRATIHWQELERARLAFPNVNFVGGIVESSKGRITGSGTLGTLDFMRVLLEELSNRDVVERVMELVLFRRERSKLEAIDSRLATAHDLMSKNLDAPLSVEQIARDCAVSVRQLNRLFRMNLASTPHGYYLELRLDRSRNLVRRTGLPLKEIAWACGFSTPSNFTRAYTKHFGTPPGKDRHLNRRVLSIDPA